MTPQQVFERVQGFAAAAHCPSRHNHHCLQPSPETSAPLSTKPRDMYPQPTFISSSSARAWFPPCRALLSSSSFLPTVNFCPQDPPHLGFLENGGSLAHWWQAISKGGRQRRDWGESHVSMTLGERRRERVTGGLGRRSKPPPAK